MRKIIKHSITMFALVALIVSSMCFFVFAETNEDMSKTSSNKYNVVFLIDESGSMKKTDSDKLRYDAVELFMSLMSNNGNYVGAVLFDEDIAFKQDIKAVTGKEDKKKRIKELRSNSKSMGDTNIGNALDTAVKMLDNNGDKSIPSVVVLLTDGNTDLDGNKSVLSKEEKKSLELKAEAIENANSNNRGYKIYTVCLNENGKADYSETKQIAKATGGVSSEVKNAIDLMDVYKMFYGLIYGDPGMDIIDGKLDDSGIISKTFDVPKKGVEELNIVITGNIDECILTKPDGNKCSAAETTENEKFTLKKISKPGSGQWKITIKGKPGTKIKVNLLFNCIFSVNDISKLEDSYHVGDEIEFKAQLLDENASVLKERELSEFKTTLEILDEKDKVVDSYRMERDDESFEYELDVKSEKSFRYRFVSSYENDDKYGEIIRSTEPKQIVVNNGAPVSNGDIKAVVKILPFKDGSYELDLSTLASDNEDSTLKNEIVKSSFIDKAEDPENGDYTVAGNILKQDGFSLYKGTYIIRSTDSGGLFCDTKVTVVALYLGLLAVILIALGILVFAIISGIALYKNLISPFAGEISVRRGNFDTPIVKAPGRGRYKLSYFNITSSSVLNYNKCYFQANAGRSIMLCTNKPVDGPSGLNKKKHIINADGTEKLIYVNKDHTETLRIAFKSELRDIPRGGGAGGRKQKPPKIQKKKQKTPKIKGTKGRASR